MSVPKLRFENGRELNVDSGITLRDIRASYPHCYLLNDNHVHLMDTFLLQDGVTYELIVPNVGIEVNLPRYPQSVFIFGDVSTGFFEPVGTCFAITNELLLTCQHHMLGNRLTGYAIALTCERHQEVVTCPYGWFEVRVVKYNRGMDYALIESIVKKDLPPIPLTIAAVEGDLDVKVFHTPIDDFNEKVEDDVLSVHTTRIKSAVPSRHHMKCFGGLFAGSSGGPFVLRNGRAVGFHCESVNSKSEVSLDGKSAEESFEIISDTLNSHVHNHASFCRALLIVKCKKLVVALRECGVELHE